MVEKSAEALDKEFNDAVNYIQNSKDPNIKLSNNDKLKFYSLYKQAVIGECNIPQPSKLKIVDRAKHDSWKALGKMTKDQAKNKFIDEFKKMTKGTTAKL